MYQIQTHLVNICRGEPVDKDRGERGPESGPSTNLCSKSDMSLLAGLVPWSTCGGRWRYSPRPDTPRQTQLRSQSQPTSRCERKVVR